MWRQLFERASAPRTAGMGGRQTGMNMDMVGMNMTPQALAFGDPQSPCARTFARGQAAAFGIRPAQNLGAWMRLTRWVTKRLGNHENP